MSREIRAQALLLESVLTHRPLPGMEQAIFLPDLAPGNDDSQLILVDERDPTKLGFPGQLNIMTKDEFASLAPNDQLQIFEFQPPEQFPGKISVRLRLSVAFPGHGFVPSGEIVATFFDQDPLTATDPTHVVAY